jgi:hypothetical protein
LSQSSSCGKSGDVDNDTAEHNAAKRSKTKLFTFQIYSTLLGSITSRAYLVTSQAWQLDIGNRFKQTHQQRAGPSIRRETVNAQRISTALTSHLGPTDKS